MIKIAVCDDEPVICEQLKQMVASKLKQWDEPFQIACYTNAVQFFYMPLDYDLIFLDIFMEQPDGMETARILRRNGCPALLAHMKGR